MRSQRRGERRYVNISGGCDIWAGIQGLCSKSLGLLWINGIHFGYWRCIVGTSQNKDTETWKSRWFLLVTNCVEGLVFLCRQLDNRTWVQVVKVSKYVIGEDSIGHEEKELILLHWFRKQVSLTIEATDLGRESPIRTIRKNILNPDCCSRGRKNKSDRN